MRTAPRTRRRAPRAAAARSRRADRRGARRSTRERPACRTRPSRRAGAERRARPSRRNDLSAIGTDRTEQRKRDRNLDLPAVRGAVHDRRDRRRERARQRHAEHAGAAARNAHPRLVGGDVERDLQRARLLDQAAALEPLRGAQFAIREDARPELTLAVDEYLQHHAGGRRDGREPGSARYEAVQRPGAAEYGEPALGPAAALRAKPAQDGREPLERGPQQSLIELKLERLRPRAPRLRASLARAGRRQRLP